LILLRSRSSVEAISGGGKMTNTLEIVLTCLAAGAVIGVGWAVLLTRRQPDWHNRYADPKKWESWIVGPVLCTGLAVGHFVQGRPYLGGTFVLMGAAALFFLLTSAIRSSMLEH
jgi:hypothetical protein